MTLLLIPLSLSLQKGEGERGEVVQGARSPSSSLIRGQPEPAPLWLSYQVDRIQSLGDFSFCEKDDSRFSKGIQRICGFGRKLSEPEQHQL